MNIKLVTMMTVVIGVWFSCPAQADTIKLREFKSAEQGEKLLRQYNYALASLDRGVAKEAEMVLEKLLPAVSYDRRLFGYTRIAVTYFQLQRLEDARTIVQKIITALRGENDKIINKVNLALAYMKADKPTRADQVLEEIALICGPDRKHILREVNIARATIAVQQYPEATITVQRIADLIANENRESFETFEFSLDSQMLDSFAGTEAH